MSCYIIAEAGVNHNGSIELAKRLVDVARAAGADAVKFQTFISEEVVSKFASKADYQGGEAENQLDLVKPLELSFNEFREIKEYCDVVGIEFLSTAFDSQSADFLKSLGIPKFKIPSGEITNKRMIQQIAAFGKPILLSTGMADLEEIMWALGWIREINKSSEVTVLQCVSAYPAPMNELNLRTITTMREALARPVGFSDHSLGITASLAAVALGAACIEKHFTLDKTMEGPDHKASLDPDELTALVKGIREIEAAMGDGHKRRMPSEQNVADVARRSLVAARDLPAGHVLIGEDILMKRPGIGIPPFEVDEVTGKTLKVGIGADELLSWDMLL